MLTLAIAAAVVIVAVIVAGLTAGRRPRVPPAHPRHRGGRDPRAALDETGAEVERTVFPRVGGWRI